MSSTHRPIVLTILDGWGYSESITGNAIHSARKPVWERLWGECPHTLIHTSGEDVGLPEDQMGNSEVGHLNMGAGRVVFQELTRISRTIKTGAFLDNPVLARAVDQVKVTQKALHIFGLLSPGGVHSREEHIYAMVELAVKRGLERIYLHAFLDGRDTPPKSAAQSIEDMEERFAAMGAGRIASIIGRYYVMDRDKRWDRTQAAYDLLTQGKAEFQAPDGLTGLVRAYERGESDEFVQATTITSAGHPPVVVEDGDAVVFMNYRADRARQITQAFIDPHFEGFRRAVRPKLACFVSLTQYNEHFDIPVAFASEQLHNVFGEYIAKAGLRQLRIAETEKYAHVTYFFNGGDERPFEGEDRILIPSPQVATYDLQPEMNAPQVTDELVKAICGGKYDVIICNFANADMVGHTGNFEATVWAVETLDTCLGRVLEALQQVGGELVITADHGNAEQMLGEGTGQAHTAHSMNPVPFIYVGRPARAARDGALSDVAPTLLYLMGMDIPQEMSGDPLVELV